MDGETLSGYAVLRDGTQWEAELTHLSAGPDGALGLAAVPGPSAGEPILLPGPFDMEPSGLAVGACRELYIADTAGNRVIWDDQLCSSRRIAPGRGLSGSAAGAFLRPRGLLLTADRLYVADNGAGRVQVLRPTTLERRAVWYGPLQEPTGLAGDSQGRVYVLDRGRGQVFRFRSNGVLDQDYSQRLAATGLLTAPGFLAVDAQDHLYVSDLSANQVFRFSPTGEALDPLPSGGDDSPAQPRALAAFGHQLYAADAAEGRIWAFDLASGAYLGLLSGFQGPVTALACGPNGSLYVKTDLGEAYVVLAAGQGYAQQGVLQAGPLDAGERLGWARLQLDAAQPAGTRLDLQFYASDSPAPPNGAWAPAPATDFLVPALPASGTLPTRPPRYLWVRATLYSLTGPDTPLIQQVQAETGGEEYLDYLPAVYARQDAEIGDLRRWLALYRSELGDLELLLEDMHRRFDPLTAPADHLPWLAQWLAFDLPQGWETDELRNLLLRVHKLYTRRGTLRGLADMVEIYSGVRPLILESYRERRLWILGQTSELGADTGLAPISPKGFVLPEGTPGTTCSLEAPEAEAGSGWSEPEGLVIGEAIVGRTAPLEAAALGQPLFDDTAYHFTVLVPAAQVQGEEQRQALIDLIEGEKPAHTDFHLCFVEPRMRVGFQARLGIDAIVAGPPEPLALGEENAGLGFSSVLGAQPGEEHTSRVGQQARLGRNLFVQ